MEKEEIVKELIETSERSKSNTHQIEEIKNKVEQIDRREESIHKIATSVEVMAKDVAYMKADISEVKESQKDLTQEIAEVKDAPTKAKARKHDEVIDMFLKLAFTGIITFILGVISPTIFK